MGIPIQIWERATGPSFWLLIYYYKRDNNQLNWAKWQLNACWSPTFFQTQRDCRTASEKFGQEMGSTSCDRFSSFNSVFLLWGSFSVWLRDDSPDAKNEHVAGMSTDPLASSLLGTCSEYMGISYSPLAQFSKTVLHEMRQIPFFKKKV